MCAFADEDESAQDEATQDTQSEEDIGSLSSRYSTLDELANSLNADESVIVDTRIGVLVAANQALDNTDVRFEGEVIGEPVDAADDMVWVAVANASGQSISVLLSADDAQAITSYGSHTMTGSTVEVTGTYHVACSEHQGELEVHASSIEVLDAGGEVTHSVSMRMFVTAAVLCGIGLALVLLYLALRHRADRRADAREREEARR